MATPTNVIEVDLASWVPHPVRARFIPKLFVIFIAALIAISPLIGYFPTAQKRADSLRLASGSQRAGGGSNGLDRRTAQKDRCGLSNNLAENESNRRADACRLG
jgi:hypothetical protein